MLSQVVMTVKGGVIIAAAVYVFSLLLGRQDAKWVMGYPFKLFVGLYLVGMLAPTAWVLYAAILLAGLIFARTRPDAVSIYIISTFAVPVAFHKIMFGGLYLFGITKYSFSSIGFLIAFLATRGASRPVGRHFDLPIIIMAILELSQAWDPYPGLFLRQVIFIPLTILLPYFLMSRSLDSEESVRRALLSLALAGFVLAIVATIETHFHWLIYKQIESRLGLASQINLYQQLRGGALRAPATFPESTSLGNFLALGGIAILAVRSSFASKPKFYAALCILLIGLMAPNSRGAFFGMAVGTLALDLYRKRWGRLSVKFGIVGGLYLMAMVAASFSPYVAEMVGKGEASRGSTEYRVLLLNRGLEEIHKHPLFGTTMKRALDNLADITQGQHIVDLVNAYVTYGLTLGYPGMIGLAAVFICPCIAMLKLRRRISVSPVLMDSAAFVFAVSSFMIGVAAFTSFGGEHGAYYYQVCAIGSSLWALRRVAVGPVGQGTAKGSEIAVTPIRALILADREAARMRRATSVAPLT